MVVAMNQPHEDLARLASYVVGARIKAGFATRKDFAVATGITARTLGKLETAAERVSADTLVRVAATLGWTPDSPALVMAGREPVLAGGEPARPPAPLRAVPPPAAGGAPAVDVLFGMLARHPDDQKLAAEVLDALVALFPEDDVIALMASREYRTPAARVESIRKWLAFLAEQEGEGANGASAGLPEGKP